MHDAAGRPTGVLRETAQRLARAAFAEEEANRSEAERDARAREQVRLANEELLRKGVTSFQDAGSGFGTVDLLRTLADEGALSVRLYVMLQGGMETLEGRLDEYYMVGYGDDRLTVRSIKQVADGALGSHRRLAARALRGHAVVDRTADDAARGDRAHRAAGDRAGATR